jgi:hypothetical protein
MFFRIISIKFYKIISFFYTLILERKKMYNFLKLLHDYYLFKILPYGNDLIKVDASRLETNIFRPVSFVYIRKDISGYWRWKKI